MFCSRCGSKIAGDAASCPNCGLVLRETGQAPPPAGQPAGPGHLQAATESRAIASLVLGILGLFFSIITGIPAIILGHLSLSNVKKSSGRLTGEGMAMSGLILGYISVAMVPFLLMIALPNLTRARMAADQAEAAANVRTLIGAETTYSTMYPTVGYAPGLATLGPGAPKCAGSEGTQKNACLLDADLGCSSGTSGQWCSKDQYKYSIVGLNKEGTISDFVITATPMNSSSNQASYCADDDGILRYRYNTPVPEPLKTAVECSAWQAL